MEKYQRTLEKRVVSVSRPQGLLTVLKPLYCLGHLDMICRDNCISTGRPLCPRKIKKHFRIAELTKDLEIYILKMQRKNL